MSPDDAQDELRARTYGLPAALGLALVFHSFSVGQFLQRTFFAMWLHETGHAVAAWLCGRPSFPGPWFTPVAADRSFVLAGVVAGALGYGAWLLRGTWLKWLLGGVLGLQLFCTLVLPSARAEQLILWAGDGGALLLGTLCMASLFVAPGSVLHRGWLRWGLVIIGAATFVDVFSLWWAASSDFDLIPYGQNEGAGLSDPSRLSEVYGWSSRQIVNRYVWPGVACLGALVGVNVVAVLRARARG